MSMASRIRERRRKPVRFEISMVAEQTRRLDRSVVSYVLSLSAPQFPDAERMIRIICNKLVHVTKPVWIWRNIPHAVLMKAVPRLI